MRDSNKNFEKKLKIKIAIIGGGNIGCAILKGILNSDRIRPSDIFVTRRNVNMIKDFEGKGVHISADNLKALKSSEVIILAVLPSQLMDLIDSLAPHLNPSGHILVSLVTAFSTDEIQQRIGKNIPVIRAVPNTAASVNQSMTCLSANDKYKEQLAKVTSIFDLVGSTLVIAENLISSATILGACGIAFFMRYIRAASQGGIQVGFHAADAQLIAAQTARGATSLLLEGGNHPESEIDKVTTPMGCTIAGLNEMEHNGLSSALIKGIVTSYYEINKLK